MNRCARRPRRGLPPFPFALVLAVAVAAPGPAGAQAAAGTGAATLEELRLAERPGGMVLELVSSGDLGLVGVQLDPDDSIVVQLPAHRTGPSVNDLFPDAGLVASVRVSTRDTARGPLTRLLITPREPLAYSFTPEGTRLRLELRPRGAPPPPSAAELEVRRQARVLEQALAEARGEAADLTGRLEQAQAENAAAAERFATLEGRRVELDQALQATLAEIQTIADDRSRERQELEARLEEAAGRERELADQIAQLEAERGRSVAERDELSSRLEAWQTESNRTEQSGQALAARLAAAEQRAAELEAQLRRIETEGLDRARTTSAANLRSGPGTEFASLQLLAEGAVVTILDRQDGWLEARTGDGDGWIWGELLVVESARVADLEAQLEAARNARSELERRLENLTREELSGLRAERDQIAGELERAKADLARLRGEGMPRATTRTGAHLRQAATAESESLALLPAGSPLEVLIEEAGWLRVRSGDAEGWIYGDLVEPESEEIARLEAALAETSAARDELAARLEALASGEDRRARTISELEEDRERLRQQLAERDRELATVRQEGLSYGLTTAAVNLRTEPGTDSEVLTLLPAGGSVELLEERGGWYRVLAGQRQGWIWGELLVREAERVAQLTAELEAARRQLDQTRERLQSEQESDGEQMEDLRAAAEAARARAGTAEAELASERERSRNLLAEKEQLAGQLSQVASEGDALRRTANSIESGARALDDQLAQTRAERDLAQQELAEARARNRTLERRLEELVNGTPPTSESQALPSPTQPAPAPATGDPEPFPRSARTRARVFLRSGPGTDYDSLALISPDVPVEVEGQEGEWVRVVVRETRGWIYGPLLRYD